MKNSIQDTNDSKKINDPITTFFKKCLISLNNDEMRKYIQIYMIEPLLNNILERIFPYIIITCILFIILILSIVIICIYVYYYITPDIRKSYIL